MGINVVEAKRKVVSIVLFFVLIAVILLWNQGPAAASSVTLLRKPNMQRLTPTSQVIVWTTKEGGVSQVEYGVGDFSQTAVATNTFFTTPDSAPYDQYHVHEATLTGLAPDTLYQYRTVTDGINLTPGGSGSFRAGKPGSASSFRFAALGDSGQGGSGQTSVANRLVQLQPDLIVHTGDVVYDASYELLEERFFQIYEDSIDSVWFAPLPGNHDTSYNDGKSFTDVFVNPSNGSADPIEAEMYYSFDYANAHFVIITSELPYSSGSDQYNWLAADLAASSAEWKIVSFHLPAYYTDQRQDFKKNGSVDSDLVPLFEQHGVDIVLGGDVHFYERMVPIKNKQFTSVDDGGILYVVTGGGGAGLRDAGVPPWNEMTAGKARLFHTVVFDITDCQLSLMAVEGGTDGFDESDVFDRYSMNKCSSGAPTADFVAHTFSGDAPLNVQFSNLSSGNPNSFSWNFGDGSSSSSEHPSHTYTLPGTYAVSLTASNGSGSDNKSRTAYITVTEPEPEPAFRFANAAYDATEAGGDLVTVTVEATSPPTVATTVNYATSNGTALAPGDYTAASGTLTFAPGEMSKTFAVTVHDDLVTETPETVNLTLSGATTAVPASATLTILDDDGATRGVRFAQTNFQYEEQAGAVAVTVQMTDVYTAPVTVDYAASSGTAVSPTDFSAVTGTLIFTPGETSKTFLVTLLEDAVVEADETVQLSLSNVVSATLLAPQTAVLTIANDDTLPTVAFASDGYTISEAGGSVNVAVQLSKSWPEAVTVNYSSSNGTATAGSDYTSTSGTLTFNPGQTSQSFAVPVTNDAIVEADEMLNLRLSSPVKATLGTQYSSAITISDNDEPTRQLVLSGGGTVTEGDGYVSFTVTLSEPSANTVTVNAMASGTTAVAGTDFAAVSETITFLPGQQQKTFSVPVIDDLLDEMDETAVVQLSGASGANLGATTQASFTILDDDLPPTVQFSAAAFSTVENQGNGSLTVNLSTASGQAVTVNYATGGGTAVPGSDYTASSSSVTFAAGETEKTILVPLINDGVEEVSETVNVTLSSPANATLGAVTQATLTIHDDDVPPTVMFGDPTYTVLEDVGTAVVPVSLFGFSTSPVAVNVASSAGTAVAGSDYNNIATTVVFQSGEISKELLIPILDDTLDELDETVTLTLSAPTGAVLGSQATAELVISDNDEPPTISFASSDVGGDEASGTVLVTVNLSQPSALAVTVAYGTGDITAVSGSDYTPSSGTLTFTPGQTSQTFAVALLDDALDEHPETAQLTLSNPTNATAGTFMAATLTIADDDAAATVQFAEAAVAAAEGGGAAELTVTLSGVSGKQVAVDYVTVAETAVIDTDFTPITGTLTFAPGQTSKLVAVPLLDNALPNDDKTFAMVLSGPNNATLGSPATAQVTIVDDEAPDVDFANSNATVAEADGTVQVEVVLSAAATETVTVAYAAAADTATDDDYNLPDGTLTFAPGETSQLLTVPIVDDNMDEEVELFHIHLLAPTGALLGSQASMSVEIEDNDEPPQLAFAAATFVAHEDSGTAEIVVQLSAPSGKQVRVNYASSNITAQAGSDYGQVLDTLTIAPGASSQSFSVPLFADDLREGNEQVQLVLGSVQNAVWGEPTTAVLTILDGDSTTLHLPFIHRN